MRQFSVIVFLAFFLLQGAAFAIERDISQFDEKLIWLLVNTKKQYLDVKFRDVTLVRFENIAIGRNGAGFKKKRGDDTTPLGTYKISWTNRKSRYKIFYGFNYPSSENAFQAMHQNLINGETYKKIMLAHKNNQVPPQNTPLGGMLGIHGLGIADRKIHESLNWTHGCIALTNEQIVKLDKWVKKGMKVVVK
jgi:L,D-peptidoglycan transpeptidase YkuD (ErfK/YbiS/YcfS/YnhG family)